MKTLTYLYEVNVSELQQIQIEERHKIVTREVNFFKGQFSDEMAEMVDVIGIPTNLESRITILYTGE